MSLALRTRVEPFGAWVRLSDGTVLALDRGAAGELGLDGGEAWSAPAPKGTRSSSPGWRAPIELHVAITSRCSMGCAGCYQNVSADGDHVSLDALETTLAAAARAGVFTVAFGGGEPLTHPALVEIGARARAHGLAPVVTTSGVGLTEERARALGVFAQVNVSHDGVDGGYRAVRGFSGATIAERAIELLVAAGVPVGVNLVLTRETFGDDGATFVATARALAERGVRELQLLRYKPRGRAATLEYLDRRLTPMQIERLPALLDRLVALGGPSIRIDCSLLPLLSDRFTSADDAVKLDRLGVMGCEAAGLLGAVDVHGRLGGCSFVDASTTHADRLGDGSIVDPALDVLRRYASAPPEPCARCAIAPICKGGCKAVSMHLERRLDAPDPECPRVRRHRAIGVEPR